MNNQLPTEAEVDSAIGELQGSFTYDPPQRWRGSYDFLRDARNRLLRAYRPAAAVQIGAWLLTVPLVYLILTRPMDDRTIPFLFIVGFAPPVVAGVARWIIERKSPVCRRLPAIERALKPLTQFATQTPTSAA